MAHQRRRRARKDQDIEGMAKSRHLFMLNPYQEYALTKCPRCGGATKVRRHCLVVHVEPHHLLCLNKSCRYCPPCDLIIARKGELEPLLWTACERYDPAAVGNEYLVFGTVDRDVWKRSMSGSIEASDALGEVHPFRDVLDLVVEPGGWVYRPEDAKRGR